MMSVCTNSNVRCKQLLCSEDILKLAPEYYDVVVSAVIYCDIVYDTSEVI